MGQYYWSLGVWSRRVWRAERGAAALVMPFAVVSFILGVGLRSGRAWAWKLALACYAINGFLGLVALNITAVLISAGIAAYLNTPRIKARFATNRVGPVSPGSESDHASDLSEVNVGS